MSNHKKSDDEEDVLGRCAQRGRSWLEAACAAEDVYHLQAASGGPTTCGLRYGAESGPVIFAGQSGWNHGNVRRSRPFWDESAFCFYERGDKK